MATYQAIPDASLDPESPVDAELMFRLRDNPLAILDGDASATAAGLRVNLDAAKTAQTSTSKVLRPNGAGLVTWADLVTGYQVSDTTSVTLGIIGTWIVTVIGRRSDGYGGYDEHWGQCVVVNGVIVSQRTLGQGTDTASWSTTAFAIASGVLSWRASYSGQQAHIQATRIA